MYLTLEGRLGIGWLALSRESVGTPTSSLFSDDRNCVAEGGRRQIFGKRPLQGRTINFYPTGITTLTNRSSVVIRLTTPAVLIVVWYSASCRSRSPEGLATLHAAYRHSCTGDARITGLDNLPPGSSGISGPIAADAKLRADAKQYLLDAVSTHPGAEAESALGQYYLAERDLDHAIDHLRNAVKLEGQNPRYHSDLAAAFLEKAEAGSANADPKENDAPGDRWAEEFGKSLEETDEALQVDSGLPEALFNHALDCQHLMLWNEARQAWSSYLEKNATGPWAVEAQRNLKLCQERGTYKKAQGEASLQQFLDAYRAGDEAAASRALGQGRNATGNSIIDGLIDSFLAEAYARRGGGTREALGMLTYAASVQTQQTKDAYYPDLIRCYSRMNPRRLREIAEARKLMSDSYQLFKNSLSEKAISGYTRARQVLLADGDSPEAVLADFHTAHCYTIQPNTKKALATLLRVKGNCEKNGYEQLLGQSLCDLANIYSDFFAYSTAIDCSLESVRLFEVLSDSRNVARSTMQLAEMHYELSDSQSSMAYLQRALTIAADTEFDPLQRWHLHALLAFNMDASGQYPAAMDCWKEATNDAREYNRPLITANTYQHLGTEFARLKQFADAIDAARAASEVGGTIKSERDRAHIVAKSCLVLGNIYRQAGDQVKAIEFYDQSLKEYRSVALSVNDYAVHKGKLLAYLALKNDDAAKSEMKAALSLVEHYRSSIRKQSQRDSFFDAEQDIYDLAIDFAYSKKDDAVEAFNRSEESRARSFLDLLESGGRVENGERGPDLRFSSIAHPHNLGRIQNALRDKAEIVQYAVLSDKVIIWVVSGNGLDCRSSQIP
ncbi:MAG TPA: hypothetical protein VI756_01230, partial [Blastocatellia bacterium]